MTAEVADVFPADLSKMILKVGKLYTLNRTTLTFPFNFVKDPDADSWSYLSVWPGEVILYLGKRQSIHRIGHVKEAPFWMFLLPQGILGYRTSDYIAQRLTEV